MKLFRVESTHYAPRNRHHALKGFAIADDEEQVIRWICSSTTVPWEDWEADGDEGEISPVRSWWESNPDEAERARSIGLTVHLSGIHPDYVTGPKSKLLRWWRGDFGDPSDTYYGCTHYSWDTGREINEVEATTLISLGVARDVRQSDGRP